MSGQAGSAEGDRKQAFEKYRHALEMIKHYTEVARAALDEIQGIPTDEKMEQDELQQDVPNPNEFRPARSRSTSPHNQNRTRSPLPRFGVIVFSQQAPNVNREPPNRQGRIFKRGTRRLAD